MIQHKEHKPLIFIHLPKTAGTSMRPLLSPQVNMTDQDNSLYDLIDFDNFFTKYYDENMFIDRIGRQKFLYIPCSEMWDYWVNNVKDKSTNDIIELHFDIINMNSIPNDLCTNELYKNFKWMTLLRDPVERVISEYLFYHNNLNNKGFALWKVKPHIRTWWISKPRMDINIDIVEYAEKKFSKNCYLKWFLGKEYFSDDLLNDNDVDVVIDIMRSLNFKVGILERLNDSIDYWNKSFGFNLNYKDMGHNRVNLNKPTISKESKEIIRKNNKLDIKLYNYWNEYTMTAGYGDRK